MAERNSKSAYDRKKCGRAGCVARELRQTNRNHGNDSEQQGWRKMTNMRSETSNPSGKTAGLHRRSETQPAADEQKHIEGDFFQCFRIENATNARGTKWHKKEEQPPCHGNTGIREPWKTRVEKSPGDPKPR